MEQGGLQRVHELVERGVDVRLPRTVAVDEDVVPERISPEATIHAGCRLRGGTTSIGPGAEIGSESPVTMVSCQVGSGVELKGGYFAESTFLAGSSVGSGAQVRAGTLLEEQASAAHAVGLKQTVLLPFVSLGSLINFCDCLLAGGTHPKNHSEVGSSYVHFNFTPRGDKATPSLIGDVPRGVVLDREPIFLGGQGGLVGPARIEYGVVIPAGTIWRKDALDPGKLHMPETPIEAGAYTYSQGLYRSIGRVLKNNLCYIGNIYALKCWYLHVRSEVARDPFDKFCHEGALARLDSILYERVERLGQLAEKMENSLVLARESTGVDQTEEIYRRQKQFLEQWPEMRDRLRSLLADTRLDADGDAVVAHWRQLDREADYIETVRSLPEDIKASIHTWLQGCVDSVSDVGFGTQSRSKAL